MTNNNQDKQAKPVTSSAVPEKAAGKPVEPAATQPRAKEKKSSSSAIVLAVIAIVLAILLTAGLYWHGHNQTVAQTAQLAKLEAELTRQQAAQAALQSHLGRLDNSQTSTDEQLAGLSRKVLDLDNKRPSDWMLAEAEYLVRMAGRKLWLEQDVVAAAMMLANADARLAALNDPSLVAVRQALAQDIASIKSLKKVDREGLVIKLNTINDQVDKLKLAGIVMAEAAEPDHTLSESVTDWKENLKKSWAGFSENFVTVRRRDGKVEALISPQQHWYLTENLKGKLLQAQLAVYREQQAVYDSSLAQASEWLTDYYADDSVRQFMLEQIAQLRDQQIDVEYPEQFSAQDRLQQLLDDRLQRLLTGL
ncbi:uroporphyrinogen-III C-methyltransferase [Zobellella maritima]|uniref:uroporphyrinogen-III C-methyltransferase n=1 Tax=Zobellella maritima TaxID=2059725 RepID=UPI000E305F6C|nr:uroporphyrinogen-III C-methyltransferase [Zobellella maritima]